MVTLRLKNSPLSLHTFQQQFTMVQLGIRPIMYTPKRAIVSFDDVPEDTLEIRVRVWHK
jgi:hypothetical protein